MFVGVRSRVVSNQRRIDMPWSVMKEQKQARDERHPCTEQMQKRIWIEEPNHENTT